jgi:uncharacterized protein YicC (UPF0701 family)
MAEIQNEPTVENEEAPDMTGVKEAKLRIKKLNGKKRELQDALHEKSDEVEEYMRGQNKKKLKIGDVECEIKSKRSTKWNKRKLQEYADEDGKVDLDLYESQETVVKEVFTMKVV